MDIWAIIAAGVVLLFGFVVVRGAPYVPSHRRFAKVALSELYEVTAKDTLVDLGSGDGVILRLAAERGAHAIGYELNPALVVISKLLAAGNPKIHTRLADYWLVDLPEQTTVIYAFSVTRDIVKLEKKVQQTVDRVGHQIWVVTYGSPLKHKQPVKVLNAHGLYLFEPEK